LKPLPESYTAGLPGCQQDAKIFFEAKVAECDRNEVEAEFKRTLVLEAQKSKRARVKKPRISKKALTAREKRDLGLDRLPKVGLVYSKFEGLHALWTEYMANLLNIQQLKDSKWVPGNFEDPKFKGLQMKICRADLHGAMIKVERADCPSHVGRQGICLMETKHTFQIISTDNKLRMMPKRGSSFSVEVDGYKFSFPGSTMLARPADRATKRPKVKMPLDF